MKLIQRLGSDTQYDKKYIDDLLGYVKAHPGSCDEVWFASDYGFPSIEVHRAHAQALKAVADRLRAAGIGVSLQISNSIGHGQYMSSRDCTGLCAPEVGTRRMVGHDGVTADYCFCWRGEVLRSYLVEEVTAYAAALQPSDILIDDDFRASNHNPVRFGCFCEDCVARFNARHGLSLTREELVNKTLQNTKRRLDWIEFVKEGLAELMRVMCEAIHKVSPDTRVGLQGCAHGAYTGYGYAFLFDVMRKATGKDPIWRGGGGFYEDSNPNNVFGKINAMAYQNSALPDYVTARCPEIENLPFTAFGKSPAGTALETALGLASGNTDESYSMMMYTPESPAFYGEYFKLLSEQRPYYEALSRTSARTRGAGIVYAMSESTAEKPITEGEDFGALRESYDGASLLWRNAIPLCFDDHADATLILHPETVRAMSDAELDAILSRNVVTDGRTVALLAARGFDVGATAKPIAHEQILRLCERILPHPAQVGSPERLSVSYFTVGNLDPYYLDDLSADAEPLGVYESATGLPAITKDPALPYGVASAILHPKQGGRLAVLAYGLWKGNVPSFQRDRILNIFEYVGAPLPARVTSLHQAVLYLRAEKESGRLLAASVCNPTVGVAEGITLTVKAPASERFVFRSQYGKECELEFTKEGDAYHLTLPSIAPYSLGTVFCE